MASVIEKELTKATKVTRKEGESEQNFLGRVARACDKLAQEDWDSLSEPAQGWANEAIEAMKNKKKISSFSSEDSDQDTEEEKEPEESEEDTEAEEEAEEEDEDEDEEEDSEEDEESEEEEAVPPQDEKDEEEEKPAKASKVVKKGKTKVVKTKVSTKAKTVPVKASKASKVVKKGRSTHTGGLRVLREIICRNPDGQKESWMEKLEAKGFKLSKHTVEFCIYDTVRTIETLRELGYSIGRKPAK